jgi:hypothetical protein
MSFKKVILLDLNEYQRLKACEAKMLELMDQKSDAKKKSALFAQSSDEQSASTLEGEGCGADVELTHPLPAQMKIDFSGPPEIPVLHENKISESDPNLLRQINAAEKHKVPPASNPGYQLPFDSQVPISKAGGYQLGEKSGSGQQEKQQSSSEHPWYYLGGYTFSDSD